MQGVGFRPTVWRLARECGLRGEVLNDGEGVLIRAWGEQQALRELRERLRHEPPPLADIEHIAHRSLAGEAEGPAGFTIAASVDGHSRTNVAADAATCDACLADIREPSNRRYRYPFTNCTHCGPRLSIVSAVPYDREHTSMSVFPMCPACEAEYENPADRRFHAQPNACPVCGPRCWIETADGEEIAVDDPLMEAANLLRAGNVVAIKGLGGFHLACDATNAGAVLTLRRRKRRYAKSLALMARDLGVVSRYATVSASDERLLSSAAAPIVVLDAAGESLPEDIAPGQRTLGFMLPYTPLHHLLLEGFDTPLVMTSGNTSDEPQAIDNDDARARLAGIADVFLMHNRDIVNRLDDSVVAVAQGEPRFLRRARGYAPEPLPLPEGFGNVDGILATGGELKNTFCLVSNGRAIVSQHQGDMEDAATLHDSGVNLLLYRQIYDFEPTTVVCDSHPDYMPARVVLPDNDQVERLTVQHHHAHLAACLAEHDVPAQTPPVLGVVLDGLGYGDDGALWGGEFLLADYAGFERVGHFEPVVLPGGAKAMREPWRNTWAHLDAALGWADVLSKYGDLEIIRWLASQPVDTFATMRARGLNSPPASSAGRLFDAVAGFLGYCRERMSHEAEAAMALEAAALRAGDVGAGYTADLRLEGNKAVLGWASMWQGILTDTRQGVAGETIAARFHAGLASSIVNLALRLAAQHDLQTAVLSGGVFQNRVLLEAVTAGLESASLRVLLPGRYPANDGGLSLGQAVVAARQLQLRST